jgi:hypothetical protein
MSVDTFKEIHRGRDGATEVSGGKTISRYTRTFIAVTTLNTDEAVTVKAHPDCPRIGQPYDENILASCRRVRARNESFSKRVWLVTAGYSTEFEAEENPLDDPVVITWNTDQYQRAYYKNRHGAAILTGAANYFDPPIEDDDPRWAVNIRYNAPGIPSWVRKYKNAINKAAFEVDGETVSKRKAKVQSIRIGEWQERNDTLYRPFGLVLHLKDEKEAGEDDDETWDPDILNRDFYQQDAFNPDGAAIPCVDGEGNPVVIPVPLDINGFQIIKPTPDNADLIRVPLFKEKDFTILPGCSAVIPPE